MKRIHQKNNPIKYCRVCGIELTNLNWAISHSKRNQYICMDCDKKKSNEYNKTHPEIHRKSNNKYYQKNKEKIIPKNVKRHRENYIGTIDNEGNRIQIKCKKREHTLKCEICNKEFKITGYHHWDDEHPENGIWTCYNCHMIVEQVEKGMIRIKEEKY